MTFQFSDYIRQTENSLKEYHDDGGEVYNPDASSAMIKSFKVLSEYAKMKKLKKVPTPVVLLTKTQDLDSCTQFRYSEKLESELLNEIIKEKGLEKDIVVEEYGNSVQIEIYSNKGDLNV